MAPNKLMVRASLVASLAITTAWGVTARAQAAVSGGSDTVAAEALFEDGRKLMAGGHYAKACPMFADSQRLDPSPATLLNLANCYEKIGRTATAWATYRAAASAANSLGRHDYEATAVRHASALEPKLARMIITVAQPVEGLTLTRDGLAVARAEWGAPIPVDPGVHEVGASAPGYKTWKVSIEVGVSEQATLALPELEAMPPGPPAPSSSGADTSRPLAVADKGEASSGAEPPRATGSAVHAGSDRESVGRRQRVAGLVVGGVGVAGMGVATALAVIARGKYEDSLANCRTGDPDLCNSAGVAQRNNARSVGDATTWALGIGVAAIAVGGALWLTAPSGSAARASSASLVVAPTAGGAVLAGAF